MRSFFKQWRRLDLVAAIFLLMLAFGCGGSTSGTGGVTIEGRVLETGNAPLSAASVTVLETGDATVTDEQGNFVLETDLSTTLNFRIEAEQLSVQSRVENLPNDTTKLVVKFDVNRDKRTVENEVTEIQRQDDSSESGSSSSSGSNSSASNNNDDFEGGGSASSSSQSGSQSSASNSFDDSEDSASSESDSSEESEESGSSSSASSGDNNDAEEGENREAEGTISAISSSAVTVGSLTFIPTAESEYRDSDGKRTNLSTFKVGDRVKAKGEVRSGILELEKLESEED